MASVEHIKSMEIDAHSIEPAVVVRYEIAGTSEAGRSRRTSFASTSSASSKISQKIIHLKNLNEFADSSTIAQVVLEMCPIIPPSRIIELEQVIFYIQKRASSLSAKEDNPQKPAQSGLARAKLEDIEAYIEMMYEDGEKNKAISYVLELTNMPGNLTALIENETLMGALARVFKEDSKKNFELATNIASIFLRFSSFLQYQSILSHYKVGALTMQLIEHEIKRWDLWREQSKDMNEAEQRKWDFAMKKQDQLITAGIKILLNLADEVRVESKMVKRGIIPMLVKCLEHKHSSDLILASANFLWKLSLFTENRQAMESLGVVEKLAQLFPCKSTELTNALLAILFNFSFDQNCRRRMVICGVVNFVAPLIEANEVALSLLYQLSIVDDAKAMITFTPMDALSTLTRMMFEKSQSKLIKATLVNISLEKRNAQLICLPDGQGLDSIMSLGLESEDVMTLKIARNISTHEGPTQEMFIKWLPQLLENAIARISLSEKLSPDHIFGVECLGISANINISGAPWDELEKNLQVISFLNKCISKAGDDVALQAVILCGTMCLNPITAKQISTQLVNPLIALLNRRQEDDEFVLQILHTFHCLLTHPELSEQLCAKNSQVVEYFINLMHDKNTRLRALCDQALQLVAENNKWWKRIAEEKFRYHNANWLEMVSGTLDGLEEMESLEQVSGINYDADDILDGDDFLKGSF